MSEIAYGGACTWWGPLTAAGRRRTSDDPIGGGAPCCPTCGGLLLGQMDEAEYLEYAAAAEEISHPGYVAFIRWTRGKCYISAADAADAYAAATGARIR